VNDLDARLARGPLRVRSVWTAGSPERLARRLLQRRRFLFGLDAVAVCGCVALLVLLSGAGGARSSASVAVAGAMAAGRVTAFSDGSVAEASSSDTELRVEQDTPERVVTKLTGGALFHVVPNHERTFEVRAGDVRVRVLGTVFSVQQLPSGQTQVLVERGRVEVAWLGGAMLLESGRGGTFPPAAGGEGEPELAGAAPVNTQPASPSSPAPAAHAAAPQHGAGGGWREEARAGNYGKAYEELSARGRDARDVRDDAADLMLAADVARLSAHPEDAIHPLRSVCERHASDRRAPIAAFTLGRVLLDDLGRPAEAASAFRKARLLWPAGPLTEDALAREADAWARAGRLEDARAAAREYVARYPQGRHVAALRTILAP
jgi:transmembrane sensor